VSRISIIIPVRNEASVIEGTLVALAGWRESGHELIVVDGRSSDATAAVAEPLCDFLVHSDPGRALQMNAGAAAARGELLVFLHADTVFPPAAEAKLLALVTVGDDCWGRFDVRFDSAAPVYRMIETLMNWRSRLTGIATGDQAIFVSRALFEHIGGFPRIGLMEDVALSAKLRQQRRPTCLKVRVTTSARRWQRDGVATTIFTMWYLRAAFYFGVSPDRLRARYDRRNAVDI